MTTKKVLLILAGITAAASISNTVKSSDSYVCSQPDTMQVFKGNYEECLRLRKIIRERQEKKRQSQYP